MNTEVKPVTIAVIVLVLSVLLFFAYRHFTEPKVSGMTPQEIKQMLRGGGAQPAQPAEAR